MFSKRMIGKLSVALLVLLVMVVAGCTKKVSIEDVTDDNNQNNSQDNNQNNDPGNNQGDNSQDRNTPPSGDDNRQQDPGNNIQFLNINLVGGEPPLQKREGIFYFTKTQHPPQVDRSFRYDTHNGWLVQLDDTSKYGQKLKVQSIKKVGSIFDIVVKFEPGGDVTKPAFGFFEVGIFDMPTTAQFRIFDEAGKKLWPKF